MYSQYQPIWSAVTLRSLHSIPPKKTPTKIFWFLIVASHSDSCLKKIAVTWRPCGQGHTSCDVFFWG